MINLWQPVHISLAFDLLTAFLLGIVHGITPDEHTWPITFSYAVGGYSRRTGMRAAFLFSLSFTVQRAIACELAYLGFGHFFTNPAMETAIYILVGIVMAISGLMISRGRLAPHLHFNIFRKTAKGAVVAGQFDLAEARPWMPLLHGMIAGWGFGAFAIVLYTVLAPAMPSASVAFLPGVMFGLGTMVTQILIGSFVGLFMARQNLPQALIRKIALVTASRTLLWGGIGLAFIGILKIFAPHIADFSISTGLHIHNLDTIDLSLVVLVLSVFGIGVGGLFIEMRGLRQSLKSHEV